MLTETLKEKNITLNKLSEITGISERYLEAITEEKYEKLPPSPYVRSYLFKIADALNLDGQKLWQEYQKNSQLKKSGLNDKLPLNRYSLKPLNKKIIFLTVLIILIAGYFIFRYNSFIGRPTVSLLGQLANAANSVVSSPDFKIEGQIKSGDQLAINKESSYVDGSGYFQKNISLQPGLNVIQLQVKRFLGREITVNKQVIYLPDNSKQQ